MAFEKASHLSSSEQYVSPSCCQTYSSHPLNDSRVPAVASAPARPAPAGASAAGRVAACSSHSQPFYVGTEIRGLDGHAPSAIIIKTEKEIGQIVFW